MKSKITICMGSSCFSRGNQANLDILEAYIANHNLQADIDLVGSRCEKKCAAGPLITIDGQSYTQVDAGTLRDILKKKFGH